MKKIILLYTILLIELCFSQKLLIPMDNLQSDHLKAYGIAFQNLKETST